MTTDTTTTTTSTTQEGPTHEGHVYYIDDDSIYKINILGDGSSSKYSYSSYHKKIQWRTNYQVVDSTDDVSVASIITL